MSGPRKGTSMPCAVAPCVHCSEGGADASSGYLVPSLISLPGQWGLPLPFVAGWELGAAASCIP